MTTKKHSRVAKLEGIDSWIDEVTGIAEERVSPAADLISAALNDEELMRSTAATLKRMTDGEPVNVDPLTEIPEAEMTIYGINAAYFDTKEELETYCQDNGLSMDIARTLEYFRSLAGAKDVIRLTYRTGKPFMYTAVDEDGYGIYNHERSVYRGEFVWEYSHGNLRGMHKAFRDRGIIFEDDIYANIDERHKKIFQMVQKRKDFPKG